MAEELLRSIKQLSRERGIEPEVFFSAIKDALLIVAKKYFSSDKEIFVNLEPEKGEISVYIKKLVVNEVKDPSSQIAWKDAIKTDPEAQIGEEIEIHLPGETLGRVAAQTARQIIMNKVQKAEQKRIYDKYLPLTGKILTGEVRRIENNNLIVSLELGEAILPPKELSPKDNFKRGEIIKFLIKRVFPEGKGPLILGTRYMNKFILELLKKEVPEVADGIVEIVSISRDPGVKTKISVYSHDKSVDPVGAIVGMNGNRVLSITKELRGERIDVIAYSDDAERFISSALTPAKVLKVRIVDSKNRKAEVTVTDDTLSAAIGRKGINIKLASKLTGWSIQLTNKLKDREKVAQKKL